MLWEAHTAVFKRSAQRVTCYQMNQVDSAGEVVITISGITPHSQWSNAVSVSLIVGHSITNQGCCAQPRRIHHTAKLLRR